MSPSFALYLFFKLVLFPVELSQTFFFYITCLNPVPPFLSQLYDLFFSNLCFIFLPRLLIFCRKSRSLQFGFTAPSAPLRPECSLFQYRRSSFLQPGVYFHHPPPLADSYLTSFFVLPLSGRDFFLDPCFV